MGNRRTRKDSVLIDHTGTLAQRCRVCRAFDIAVEARDDVSVRRVLEVLCLFLQYALLLRDLFIFLLETRAVPCNKSLTPKESNGKNSQAAVR